jgi:malate dehydrogenase (oxaloacetate-decarboxylating)(NADP+)
MSTIDRKSALDYHEFPVPGKISVTATKSLVTQRDLSLAYTPGVALACEEIRAEPANAFRFTSRGNLVGVITNGTAVLGLGNIGPLASKPVMEGKAVLFKKFAGIDVFDIEINETDPDKLVDIIAGLEPTFGGINLEDIKAPECFIVERKLRERTNIPIFHDDQHGTAITVAAAFINGLKVVGKKIDEVKVRRPGLPGPYGGSWRTPGKHLGVRHRRRRLSRPPRSDEPRACAFRTGHRGPHPGRHHRWRRRIPGPVGRRRAQA